MTINTQISRGRKPTGFSLAELMVAIGILGVGLTMAATLFPTAIKLNEMSTKDALGTIIAENGLATAKSLLSYGNVADPNLVVLADEDPAHTGLIDPNWQQSPVFDPNAPARSRLGFVVLGRRYASSTGLVQLVIVSYDKKTPGGQVIAQRVQITSTGNVRGAATVVLNNYGDKIESPLILEKDGTYATITGYDETNGQSTLDHEVGVADDYAYVIVETAGATPVAASPAMAVLVADAALQ